MEHRRKNTLPFLQHRRATEESHQSSETTELSYSRVLSIHTTWGCFFWGHETSVGGSQPPNNVGLVPMAQLRGALVPVAHLRGAIIHSLMYRRTEAIRFHTVLNSAITHCQRTDTVSDRVSSYYCLLWYSRPMAHYGPFLYTDYSVVNYWIRRYVAMPPVTVIAYLHSYCLAFTLYVHTRWDPPGIVLRRITYVLSLYLLGRSWWKTPHILKRPFTPISPCN